MATADRLLKRAQKRQERFRRNRSHKALNLLIRQQREIALGKTVLVTEVEGVKTYAFPPKQKVFEPPTPPRSHIVGLKQHRHPNPRKNLSGHAPEHAAANIENASRAFARVEITPEVDGVPIATEVIIGEFADHDPARAAIDHAIATGEPLFTEPVEPVNAFGEPFPYGEL